MAYTENTFHRNDGACNIPNRNRNGFGVWDELSRLAPFYVGFDETFDKITKAIKETSPAPAKYPPYNIVKYSDTEFSIQIAVAGFGKNEIDLEYKEGILTVAGKEAKPQDIDSDYVPPIYLHKGIATRDFTHKFNLAEDVEVKDAQLFDGILTIYLVKHIPEHKKPKKIEINSIGSSSSAEFLAG